MRPLEYFFESRKKQEGLGLQKDEYTFEVPGAPDIPGEGKPRRHFALKGYPDLISAPADNHIQSLYDNLEHGAKVSNNGPFLGHREINIDKDDGKKVAGPYIWQTYGEVIERTTHLGSGFANLGLKPYQPLGLFSINRPEWVIGEYACFLHSFVTVPLYDTLGQEAIVFIINQTEMTMLLATSDAARQVVKTIDKLPTLKCIVIMDDSGGFEEIGSQAAEAGVKVVGMGDVERDGTQHPVEPTKATPEDIATICYTSGTTGVPKGVVLTHRNFLSVLFCIHHLQKTNYFGGLSSQDVYVSYLPLAHIMERIFNILVIGVGACIGFYQGNILKLLDDIAQLKPTLFVSVPRLFNRIYDKVWNGARTKGGAALLLFHTAYNQKKAALRNGIVSHWLWDRLVFSQVRSKLGGRVRLMCSGSAPLAPEIMDFLRICFSASVYEGYGQTETTAGISITPEGETEPGNVGIPLPCGEVKLADVSDMGYTSADKPRPRGEVLVRGNQVFREYYKCPEKTAEVRDKDGWMRTGDIGEWDSKGRLVIIDRVKNIFKLAQGEYIAPEKIENVYSKHELVAQAFVYGDSLQAALVGVIVPDEETLLKWTQNDGTLEAVGSFEELCRNRQVKNHILSQLIALGRTNGLAGFENVKDIYLEPHPFTPDKLLTPTFKLKRHEAKIYYKEKIEAMYAEMSA